MHRRTRIAKVGLELTSLFKPHEMDLLHELADASVEFVVVGGAAVVLHGHFRPRKDLDILISGSHENLDKLKFVHLSWLSFKHYQIEKLKQEGAKIQDPVRGIDFLKEIAGVQTDDVLRDRTLITEDGFPVPVISLEHLIASKNSVGECSDIADVEALLKVNGTS